MLAGEVDPRSSTQSGVSTFHKRESSPRPLERRVSFSAAWDVVASDEPDEPRKSFMKFCVTDAITLTRGDRRRKLLSRSLLRLTLNINFTLQVGALLNRNPLRGDIPGNNGGLAQLNPVAGLYVALEFALDHDHLRFHRGFDLAVGTDGQAVVFEGDAALDLPVNVKIFAARQFTFDNHGFANLSQIA